MAIFEVMAEQFRGCVNNPDEATRCSAPLSSDSVCDYNHPERVGAPMNCVRWAQAVDFCMWHGGCVPMEAVTEEIRRLRP